MQTPLRSTSLRLVAVLVSLVLLASPLFHAFHLISEPHWFCALHGHFASVQGLPPGESGPPDRGEHEDEDPICLLVNLTSNCEIFGYAPFLAVVRVQGLDELPCVSTVIPVQDVFVLAPKHSPPTSVS